MRNGSRRIEAAGTKFVGVSPRRVYGIDIPLAENFNPILSYYGGGGNATSNERGIEAAGSVHAGGRWPSLASSLLRVKPFYEVRLVRNIT